MRRKSIPQRPSVEDQDFLPPSIRREPGFIEKTWDIGRYTAIAANSENPKPEQKIIDWIFRATGSSDWHGEKVAILSASRAVLRAYHDPKTIKKVDDVVKRFIDSYNDRLSVRCSVHPHG